MSGDAFNENEPFTLQDCYLGPRAGQYVVRAEHKVHVKADKLEWKGDAEVTFAVTAPRLRLPSPGVVHACYPPPGASAFFGDSVPYVSLSRRSLPWERSLPVLTPDSTPAERATPWLALLVLTPDDLRAAVLRTATGAALANPADAAAFYSPWVDPALADDFALTADERAAEVGVLELDAPSFRAICPKPREALALAHVRSVDARAKRIGDAQSVAHYAVVLANRLPQAGPHTAALVSLEGWAAWLDGTSPSKAPRVRVVVLHTWQFTSRDGVGSCARWVREKVAPGPMSVPQKVIDVLGRDCDRARLTAGYVPIQWRPAAREAETGFGWYRGPLSAVPVDVFGDDTPTFEHPDAALVVDDRLGMVDHSYAAAWQIGRLLALSSASFATALRSWSRAVYLEALRQEELRGSDVTDASTAALQTLAQAMAERFRERPKSDANATPPRDDVRVAAEWLADLMLLQGVPFHYLVPSDKLLPAESLRVFYVDGRWLDALADGAISVGVASLKNRAPLRSKRGDLRRVLRWLMEHRRALSRGEALPTFVESGAPVAEPPLCGFLLRSGLLKNFPGVEVEVWGRVDTPEDRPELERLAPLRIDLVAEDVLLVIARGYPARVVVREPREGLRFGRVDGRLYARDSSGARADGKTIDVKTREGAPGVIDVSGLAASIGGAETPVGGALYALQWLLPPQDVWIQWERVRR